MCVAAGLECTSKCLESWRRWKGGRSCILLSDYLDFFFQQVYFTFLGGSITSFIVQSSRQMDTSPVGSGSSLPGLVLLGKQIWNASRIYVSSLRRGHANLLCIVPILVYVLPKRALYFTFKGKKRQCFDIRVTWVQCK